MRLPPLLLGASVALLAQAALLVAASPGAALSGAPVAGALRVTTVVSDTKSRTKSHTCQAGSKRQRATRKARAFGDPRNTSVVACEQPPRSEVVLPTLKQTSPNPLAVFG